MSQPAQLSLAVQLPDDETFASFYPGDNAQLITNLKNAAIGQGAPLLFVWGSHGSGRSHLLHATCAEVNASGDAAAYIPLEQHAAFDPGVLDQMEQLQNMGDLSQIAGMLPGNLGKQLDASQIDEKQMAHTKAIILSMTPLERENPQILNASRKKRIAAGAGLKVEDVNRDRKSVV